MASTASAVKNKTAAMDLLHGKRNHHMLIKNLMILPKFDSFDDFFFVIVQLPYAWLLKLTARALIMSLIIISLPWLNAKISGLTSNAGMVSDSQSPINAELLPVLFRDFANEGIIKTRDKIAIVSDEDRISKSGVISDYKMDVISSMDSDIINNTYDFIFVHDLVSSSKFIEQTLKKDGVVAFLLGENPENSLHQPSDYKIVYLRRFDSTAIALKKLGNHAMALPEITPASPAIGRRPLGLTPEVKKKALTKLEDVLLEPPRAASGKSSRYRKKTRFLPDLTRVPLESYPRRLFIDVGSPDNRGDSTWFSKNYPTQNTEFEMIKVETVVSDEEVGKDEVSEVGMSEWLRRNVEEREFVVMTAEAEVVEELVRSKAIGLVDELFLECKHRGIKKSAQRSRRAYWECLALYGKLRDEGVAVHQWWG